MAKLFSSGSDTHFLDRRAHRINRRIKVTYCRCIYCTPYVYRVILRSMSGKEWALHLTSNEARELGKSLLKATG